jgi:hypothetical protein
VFVFLLLAFFKESRTKEKIMKTNKTEKVKEREQLAKQKQHLVKEVNSTYTFRKLIIFIAPIFGVICAGYLLFGILGDMGIHSLGRFAFVNNGHLTGYGIAGMVIIGLSIVCSVIS